MSFQKKSLWYLNSSNYRTYNIHVVRRLQNIKAAILLQELCNRHDYHLENNELVSHEKHGDGWFYYTTEKCTERTFLSDDEQLTSLNLLKKLGLVEQKNFGLPCKRHFRLDVEKIEGFFGSSKNDYSRPESQQQENENNPTFEEAQKKSDSTPPKSPVTVPEKVVDHTYKENKEEPHVYEVNVNNEPASPVTRYSSEFHCSGQVSLTDPKDEESNALSWLVSKKIDTDIQTLRWWAKTYSIERLKEVYEDVIKRNPRSVGAYMHKLLKEQCIVSSNDQIKQNREYANFFSQLKNWALKIYEKYAKFDHCGSECEIGFNMPHKCFQRYIDEKYQSLGRA